MTPIIDLNYKKKEEPEQENELFSFIGWISMVGFSLFLAYMFFTGLCGGRFW